MVNFKEIIKQKTVNKTGESRLVLTYPQKSLETLFTLTSQKQRELIVSLCETLSESKNLTPHQQSIVIFGILHEKYNQINQKRKQ